MNIKGPILLGIFIAAVLNGCAGNEQNEPEDVNYQPTRYDQDEQRNRLDNDNGEDTRPDVDYPIIDREEQEIEFGDREIDLERPFDRSNNHDNNREMDE